MNGKQAKKLRKMCKQNDPTILLAVRNVHGKKTTTMTPRQVYQAAKKIFRGVRIKN